MRHNQERLMKLERWARIVAWYEVFNIALVLIVFLIFRANFEQNLLVYCPLPSNGAGFNFEWYQCLTVLVARQISGLFGSIIYCLMFFGLSFAIRYLLALLDTARNRPRRISNPVRS